MPERRARLIVSELPAPGARIRLAREEAAHVRARRLREGDTVRLVDGSSREADGRVVSLRGGVVEVLVGEARPAPGVGPELVLLVAAVRTERLSWLVEKATELQATRIVLLRTARTQGFRATESVVPRLQRVARAAAKQSDQARWPEIGGPIDFFEALTLCGSLARFLLDFEGEDLASQTRGGGAVLVGPEGGWTGEERAAATARGWLPASLPAGKLRAETAAIAALVLLRAATKEKT